MADVDIRAALICGKGLQDYINQNLGDAKGEKYNTLCKMQVVLEALHDQYNQLQGAIGGIRFEECSAFIGYYHGQPRFTILPCGPTLPYTKPAKWFVEEITTGATFEGSIRDCMDWCRSLGPDALTPATAPTVQSPQHQPLWDAINAYAKACGGDTGSATISDARMNAVADIARALYTNPADPPHPEGEVHGEADVHRRGSVEELDRPGGVDRPAEPGGTAVLEVRGADRPQPGEGLPAADRP